MDIKTGLNLQRCFNASGRLRIVAAINVLLGVYYYPIGQTDFSPPFRIGSKELNK